MRTGYHAHIPDTGARRLCDDHQQGSGPDAAARRRVPSGACFTHGQLYVAASRVGLPEHLHFAVPLDEETRTFRTRNVVFREALTS